MKNGFFKNFRRMIQSECLFSSEVGFIRLRLISQYVRTRSYSYKKFSKNSSRLLMLVGGLLLFADSQAALTGTLYSRVPGNPYVDGTAMQGYELIATRSCSEMSCIQQNIRVIDSQIADLIARRLAFVKRGAQLKNSAIVPNNTQHNPNIITQVTRQAQAQGYPPEIAQSVFTEIDRQSQAYENRFEGRTPQSSPDSLATPLNSVNNPVITPTITPGLGVTPTITPGAPGQP